MSDNTISTTFEKESLAVVHCTSLVCSIYKPETAALTKHVISLSSSVCFCPHPCASHILKRYWKKLENIVLQSTVLTLWALCSWLSTSHHFCGLFFLQSHASQTTFYLILCWQMPVSLHSYAKYNRGKQTGSHQQLPLCIYWNPFAWCSLALKIKI